MISNKKFKKILNDIKRRSEDAAIDLNIDKAQIDKYISGESAIPFKVIKRAVKKWSLNYNDFFDIQDDAPLGYKHMSCKESNLSERLMFRKNKPYYLYKDTAYSRLSPFKPEWIEELLVVDDNDPNNESVVFNNGHFLHQFTYFIGYVNFYYIIDNKKYVQEMNTGDSMYISPYIPHSFATRRNEENINGVILALTYTDKLDHNCVDELNAIGIDLSKNYQLNLENELESFKSNLRYHLNVNSLSLIELEKQTKIENLKNIFKINQLPKLKDIKKIAECLNVNLRDMLPYSKNKEVVILRSSEQKKWYFPEDSKKYFFKELASSINIPTSRAFEVIIKNDDLSFDHHICTPTHQYIYNLGEHKCSINLNDSTVDLNHGDSIYLKPNLKHTFIGNNSKLLILRTGGKISGDQLLHLSLFTEKNLNRLIDDKKTWFEY